MAELELLDAIEKRLEVVLKDIHHPTDPSRGRDQHFKSPKIIQGYLPAKRSGEQEEDFPFVIIRASKWKAKTDEGITIDTLDVKYLVGSYGSESDDFKYVVNIWRRILNDLRQQPCLNDKYRVNPGITAEMPDEQARDIYFLEAVTTWELPTPQEVEKDDGYNPET